MDQRFLDALLKREDEQIKTTKGLEKLLVSIGTDVRKINLREEKQTKKAKEEKRRRDADKKQIEDDKSKKDSKKTAEAVQKGIEQASGSLFDPFLRALKRMIPGAAVGGALFGMQQGGMYGVPGMGQGDKVPARLAFGASVVNRNAAKFLPKMRTGGINAMLEPGEVVVNPGHPFYLSSIALNKAVPRFQNGGQYTGPGSLIPPYLQTPPPQPLQIPPFNPNTLVNPPPPPSTTVPPGAQGPSIPSSPVPVPAPPPAAPPAPSTGSTTTPPSKPDIGLSELFRSLFTAGLPFPFNNIFGGKYAAAFARGIGSSKLPGTVDKLFGNPMKFIEGFVKASGIEGLTDWFQQRMTPPTQLNSTGQSMLKNSGSQSSNNIQKVALGLGGGSDREYREAFLAKAARAAGFKGKELAAFMAQTSHESDSFNTLREYWGPTAAQRGYEGRSDLGNNQPGDGKRFMGRGYIQITGRANYRDFGKIVGEDLITNPARAEDPNVAAKVAIAYWKNRVRPMVNNDWDDVFLHSAAVNNPSARSTSAINGYADRERKYFEYVKKIQSGNYMKAPPQKTPGGVELPFMEKWNKSGIGSSNVTSPPKIGMQNGGVVGFDMNRQFREASNVAMGQKVNSMVMQPIIVNAGGGGGNMSTPTTAPEIPDLPNSPTNDFVLGLVMNNQIMSSRIGG